MDTQNLLEIFKNTKSNPSEILEIPLSNDNIESIGYKSFIDVAQLFFYKMLTPTIDTDTTTLRFKKLDTNNSFHNISADEEKYGIKSKFFEIDKTKEVSFLYYYQKALKFADIQDKKHILNLGINKGDEFLVIKDILDSDNFFKKKFIGIDYAKSAIEYAKKTLNETNIEFIHHDINKLSTLNLPKSDMLISIGTLQSSNINFNERFMDIYQNYLTKDASIILGFPNCRWIDGEMIYGAKAKNYPFSEMSVVLKDIHFCKKYLQKKGYRVIITGKDYLFLTARKIK